MSDKKRESGFYWVKFDNRWCVAEYQRLTTFSVIMQASSDQSFWTLPADTYCYSDSDFTEITSQKLNPPHES